MISEKALRIIDHARFPPSYYSVCDITEAELDIIREAIENLDAEVASLNGWIDDLIGAIRLGKDIRLIHEPEISSIQKWYATMERVIETVEKERSE